MYIFAMTLAVLVLDLIQQWFERGEIIEEFQLMPDRKWARGLIHMRGEWREFIEFRLPSYKWEQYDFGRHEGWGQLHVAWFRGIGWKHQYVRVPSGELWVTKRS